MLLELQKAASKLTLTFSDPQTVRNQIRQLILTQKELNVLKKRLSNEIRAINANRNQTHIISPDIADIFRQNRRNIKTTTQQLKQPLTDLKLYIDTLDLKADKLKFIAEQYLINPNNPQLTLDLQRELADIPLMPTFTLKNQGIDWEWVCSVILFMFAIGAFGTPSIWAWLSSPFWAIAGATLNPPLHLKIQDQIEHRTDHLIPYKILRIAIISICIIIALIFFGRANP